MDCDGLEPIACLGFGGGAGRRYAPKGHAGSIRLLAYDRGRTWAATRIRSTTQASVRHALTAAYRYKYGFGINIDQGIRKNLDFSPAWLERWQEPTFEFTDVIGPRRRAEPERWGMETPGRHGGRGTGDERHQRRAQAVPCRRRPGDYRWRWSARLQRRAHAETYYNCAVAKHFQLTLDYQYARIQPITMREAR